jgi:LPXTG-site transpeptidase (sortase) family protein
VAARVGRLDTTTTGELETPQDPATIGWWDGGATPGEPGSAVLVGHRDSETGPAVFYGLGDLTRGDLITVTDASGIHRTFTVTALEQVEKNAFPTEAVYGDARSKQLRLLTCAGPFESDEYEDNLIVYAAMT